MLLDEDEILKLIKSLQKDYKFILIFMIFIELQIVCLSVLYLL
jgi:hypothetical protein